MKKKPKKYTLTDYADLLPSMNRQFPDMMSNPSLLWDNNKMGLGNMLNNKPYVDHFTIEDFDDFTKNFKHNKG